MSRISSRTSSRISDLYRSKLSGSSVFGSASSTPSLLSPLSSIPSGILKNTVGPNAYNEFSTIQSALNSRVPTAQNPMFILVEPGEYAGFTVSNPYVLIRGSGRRSTVISSGSISFTGTSGRLTLSQMEINVDISSSVGELTIKNCVLTGDCECAAEVGTLIVFENLEWSSGTLTLSQGNVSMKNVKGDVGITSTTAKGDLTIQSCTLGNLSFPLASNATVKQTEINVISSTIGDFTVNSSSVNPDAVITLLNSTVEGDTEITSGDLKFLSTVFEGECNFLGVFETRLSAQQCRFYGAAMFTTSVGSSETHHSVMNGCEISSVTIDRRAIVDMLSCYQSLDTPTTGNAIVKNSSSTEETKVNSGKYRGKIQHIAGSTQDFVLNSAECYDVISSAKTIVHQCKFNSLTISGEFAEVIGCTLSENITISGNNCTATSVTNTFENPSTQYAVVVNNGVLGAKVRHSVTNNGPGLLGIVQGSAIDEVLTTGY